MRETRLSGSEGGETETTLGLPYPYQFLNFPSVKSENIGEKFTAWIPAFAGMTAGDKSRSVRDTTLDRRLL